MQSAGEFLQGTQTPVCVGSIYAYGWALSWSDLAGRCLQIEIPVHNLLSAGCSSTLVPTSFVAREILVAHEISVAHKISVVYHVIHVVVTLGRHWKNCQSQKLWVQHVLFSSFPVSLQCLLR